MKKEIKDIKSKNSQIKQSFDIKFWLISGKIDISFFC